MNKLFRITKEKLYHVVLHAYANNDIELIEFVLNNEQLKKNLDGYSKWMSQPFIYKALQNAAASDNIEILSYIIKDDFKILTISDNNYKYFFNMIHAISLSDNLEMIKKISIVLTKEIDNNRLLPTNLLEAQLASCANKNQIEMIRYFLCDQKWQSAIDEKVSLELIAESAYVREQFDVVKFLLQSPDLPYLSCPNYLFLKSLLQKNQEMIHYFIFDYEIKNDQLLQKAIKELKCPEINDLIEQRELKNGLTISLNEKIQPPRKKFKL